MKSRAQVAGSPLSLLTWGGGLSKPIGMQVCEETHAFKTPLPNPLPTYVGRGDSESLLPTMRGARGLRVVTINETWGEGTWSGCYQRYVGRGDLERLLPTMRGARGTKETNGQALPRGRRHRAFKFPRPAPRGEGQGEGAFLQLCMSWSRLNSEAIR